MKRIWRAAAAALVSAAAAAVLLSSPGSTLAAMARPATPVPPAPSRVLTGTWVNTNPKTINIADIVVAATAKGVTVDPFAARCGACEWGRIAVPAFAASAHAKTGTSFAGEWQVPPYIRYVLLASYGTPKKVPTLTVTEFTMWADGGPRPFSVVTERFTKGKAVKVTMAGTSTVDYPPANPVTPAPALPAIWINTAVTGNIRAVIVSAGPGGALKVHAYGYCAPVPCSWGAVAGTTFTANLRSLTAGTAFLAPYKFSSSRRLLYGTVNTAGTKLTVQTWTEFTDHSGRSNYTTKETLVPLR